MTEPESPVRPEQQTRPQLWARNNTVSTITFNYGWLRWELPPYPDPNYKRDLPWKIAAAPGFDRLWDNGKVTVAMDEEFYYIIHTLPKDASLYIPYVHRQLIPQSTVDIEHGLDRDGPVTVTMFSLDGQIEYFNFRTEVITRNICRISTDDPLTFQATVF